MPAMRFFWKSVPSPVGTLTLIARDLALVAILWENESFPLFARGAVEQVTHSVLRKAETQLQEYFAGQRQAFSLKLDFHGTEFQKDIWQALRPIPYGKTETYARIAEKSGHSRAIRAAGAAIGKNPIPIIVPCHRVIGSNGKLTGFAGGLKIKKFLLELEGCQTQ